MATCSAIIVTHNSEKHLKKAVDALLKGAKKPDQIIIVDSGSKDITYLTRFQGNKAVRVVLTEGDVGFCRANNIGMQHIDPKSDYILFVNPDAFVTDDFLERATSFMEDPGHNGIAVMTPALLGYDIDADKPTGRYDSTGVFPTWYGRWYDRDQGIAVDKKNYTDIEAVPAICGALMFCRRCALDEVLFSNGEVFDNSFYMYKEDVDLSQRLRAKGWSLFFCPMLTVYHCRGWASDRSKMPRRMRLASARNNVRVNRAIGPVGIFYAALKYAAVKFLNV